MRYERKYELNYGVLDLVGSFLALNGFFEVFPKRQVSSIYFDTNDLEMLCDNLDGISHRKKYRVRWYDGNYLTARFEEKRKDSMLGTKIVSPISNACCAGGLTGIIDSILGVDDASFLDQGTYAPILLVEYERRYYSSYDNLIRATIDTQLSCEPYSNCLSKDFIRNEPLPLDSVILEFKYNSTLDSYFRNIIVNDIPFRSTKYSKYVNSFLSLQESGLI